MVNHLGDVLASTPSRDSSESPSSSGSSQALPDSHRDTHLLIFPAGNRTSRSPNHVGTPSAFSISSVDPLHFLGVTPTYQSGELLHACQFTTLMK